MEDWSYICKLISYWMEVQDKKLIRELRKGKEESFKKFYLRYYKLFRSFSNGFELDTDQAEDTVQEAFIKYWERREQFDSIDSIKAFLYSTIRNQSINLIKHKLVKLKHVEAKLKDMTTQEFFLNRIIKEEVHSELYSQLEELGDKAKQVLYLSLEGKKNEDIAEELGIALTTVKTHKKRAYKILRTKLKDIYSIISLLPI